jgi:hypothetical protein
MIYNAHTIRALVLFGLSKFPLKTVDLRTYNQGVSRRFLMRRQVLANAGKRRVA